jgi:hypothetical protein
LYVVIKKRYVSDSILYNETSKRSKDQKAFLYVLDAKKVSNLDDDAKIVSKGAGVRDSGY